MVAANGDKNMKQRKSTGRTQLVVLDKDISGYSLSSLTAAFFLS